MDRNCDYQSKTPIITSPDLQINQKVTLRVGRSKRCANSFASWKGLGMTTLPDVRSGHKGRRGKEQRWKEGRKEG